MAEMILNVDCISKSFGALCVADEISFQVYSGEVVGIIGPNGAGKTTLFGLLSGSVALDGGTIELKGKDITNVPAYKRARVGLARTYQVPKPFTHMTVDENLEVAALFGGGLEREECSDWISQVVELTGLEDVRWKLAGRLPLLSRKRHELARALATRPNIILVDEVAAGLTDAEVDEFISLIHAVRDSGITVIWIEHVMKTMLSATDRLLALAGGQIISSGSPTDVVESKEVRRVYLGV